MRAGIFTCLTLLFLCMAFPLGHDPQYFGQLNTRQIAAEPAAPDEEKPLYQILEDLTPAETAYLVQTNLVFSKDPAAAKINLFDFLLAWQKTIDTYVAQVNLPHFSADWHAFLKDLRERTSKKGRLTGTAFLNTLANSPLAEEIIIHFMQQQLVGQLRTRLLAKALASESVWAADEWRDEDQDPYACGPRTRWPQIAAWINDLATLRPRPLGLRDWRQLNGGTYLIKKHLPSILWGNGLADEPRLAEALNELWMAESSQGPQLCSKILTPTGQLALRDLGLPPIADYISSDNPAVPARLQKQIASGRIAAAAFEIYCHKFMVPQIFEVIPSPKDQKRHQLDLKIALRYFER